MPHTKEELIKMINLDEPDYERIVSRLTKDDIPLLTELSKDQNPAIATKAISCLGLMQTDKALSGLQDASKHPDPVIRIAAAQALRNMSKVPAAVNLLGSMLDDGDIGVRKFALKSVEHANISTLKEKVQKMSQHENNEHLKNLSGEVLQKLK